MISIKDLAISSSLSVGEIFNLVIDIIEQNTRAKLILHDRLKRQLVFICIHFECYLFKLLGKVDGDDISS